MREPIRYTLRFPEAQNHYVEVTATIPATGPIELFMAVWTPGSYLIREYSQHVESFSASAPWAKTSKNRWRLEASGEVTVSYRVYGRTLGVQSNWIEARFALLNGAPTFLSLVEEGARPHEVTVELPAEWDGVYTGLDTMGPQHYRAADYDTLVDCPIYAGSPAVYPFEADGKPHFLINEGEAGVWDGAASAEAAAKIVAEYQRMMGPLPYERYLFLNLLLETGGGLEHKNSTVLFASRWAWRNTEEPALDAPAPRKASRSGWLDLVSHEYFHVWNVKRLRPVELGPFDYEQENYTRTLWVAEGITTYYGPLAVKRAGLTDRATYFKQLSQEISRLQTTAGRLVQPIETSSFDAWIKLYRQNENSTNTLISYYTKGAVIAWLMDARVRRATHGARSLDDVMRQAYERFPNGYTSAGFRQLVSEVAGEDFSEWFTRVLDTTEELDYADALNWFGLRFAEGKGGEKADLGASTKKDWGRLLVTSVVRGSAAYRAGLNVDDELLAIDGFRVRPESLSARLEGYRPGQTVELLVARREQLRTLAVTLDPEPRKVWLLEPDPEATAGQRSQLADWLRD